MTKYFIESICKEQGLEKKEFSKEALSKLKKYPWTGNVRELRNVGERLMILGENPITVKNIEKLTKIGVSSGIDVVVSSPKEVKLLREKFGKLILVTPGIRLPDDNKNDQKRIETPATAIKNGSSLTIINPAYRKPLYFVPKSFIPFN